MDFERTISLIGLILAPIVFIVGTLIGLGIITL